MKLDVGPKIDEPNEETVVRAEYAVEQLRAQIDDLAGRRDFYGRTGVELQWERGQISTVRPTAAATVK